MVDDLPEHYSKLKTFVDVVADATRRFNAGELDEAGYIRALERQGYTPAAAKAEVESQKACR